MQGSGKVQRNWRRVPRRSCDPHVAPETNDFNEFHARALDLRLGAHRSTFKLHRRDQRAQFSRRGPISGQMVQGSFAVQRRPSDTNTRFGAEADNLVVGLAWHLLCKSDFHTRNMRRGFGANISVWLWWQRASRGWRAI